MNSHWEHTPDAWILRADGEYVGWVQEARTLAGEPLPGWMANWKIEIGTPGGRWAFPFHEEPGHYHPSFYKAALEVEHRAGIPTRMNHLLPDQTAD
jgi:hypothetical protein